jgi:hypothetical protein
MVIFFSGLVKAGNDSYSPQPATSKLFHRLQLVLHSFHAGFGDGILFAIVRRLVIGLTRRKVGILLWLRKRR